MKKIVRAKGWTKKRLLALGIPAVCIPGLLLAIFLGWNPTILQNTRNYYQISHVFPKDGEVSTIVDGDTFILKSGVVVRMLGIDAPGQGERGFDDAKRALETLLHGKMVYLEYDRYQDDKYGRILTWTWVGCEKNPIFLPADYMHLSGNTSREGLFENPEGCKEGMLVNQEMVDGGWAHTVSYIDRGPLKYAKRIGITPPATR